ncbi:hypothetical protein C8R47DRAFT_1085355 [Mycena vitilis]|nr:hypothetical protein C8R47DRAFT_1085355 [Mycena vitilis]
MRTRPNEAFGVGLPEMLLDDEGPTNFCLPPHLRVRPVFSPAVASTTKVVALPPTNKFIVSPSTTVVTAMVTNKVVTPSSSGNVPRIDKWPAKMVSRPLSGEILELSPFTAQRDDHRQAGLIAGSDIAKSTGRVIHPPSTSTYPPAGIRWTATQLEMLVSRPNPTAPPSKRPRMENDFAGSSAPRSSPSMLGLAAENTPADHDTSRSIARWVPYSPKPQQPLANNSSSSTQPPHAGPSVSKSAGVIPASVPVPPPPTPDNSVPRFPRLLRYTAFGVALPLFLLQTDDGHPERVRDYCIPDFLGAVAAYENRGAVHVRTRRTDAFGVRLPKIVLNFDQEAREFALPDFGLPFPVDSD